MRKIGMMLTVLLVGVASWSCLKESTGTGTTSGSANGFDYKTSDSRTVDLNYALNGYEKPVLFEIYAEYPFVSGQSRELKSGLEPVLRAYTDATGAFNGSVLLPTWCKQIYLRSAHAGMPELIALSADQGTIRYDAAATVAPVSAGASRAAHDMPSDIVAVSDWNNLGKLQVDNGVDNISASLMTAIDGVFQKGISINKHHSNLLGKLPTLEITKNNGANRVTLTFVHSDGLNLNTLGYYSYPTATPPTSLDQVKKIVALPNATYVADGGAMKAGYSVDLKYWTGSTFVAGFPKGTSIGFFVIKDGFDPATGNIVEGKRYYSNSDLTTDRQQIVAFGNSGNGIFIAGVETADRFGASDNDFRDLVFYVESFPRGSASFENVIVDPEPQPEPEPTYTTYKGTLIFEDLWPTAGDYDLNDVVVEYTSKVWINVDNQVVKTEDSFLPVNNGAQIQSGFAYRYGVAPSAVKSVNVVTDFVPAGRERNYVTMPWNTDGKGFETGQDRATLRLFDDIRNPGLIGQRFDVTTEFNAGVTVEALGFPPYDPFIVIIHDVTSDPRNRELHLTNYAPTPKASYEWFGVNADHSAPPATYYVSDNNYPFAINLPIHGFVLSPETVRIDETYPEYYGWAISKGRANERWYENPR